MVYRSITIIVTDGIDMYIMFLEVLFTGTCTYSTS